MRGDRSSNEIEELRSLSGILRSGSCSVSGGRPEVVGLQHGGDQEVTQRSTADLQPITLSGGRREVAALPQYPDASARWCAVARNPVCEAESASSRSKDQCPERRNRTRR